MLVINAQFFWVGHIAHMGNEDTDRAGAVCETGIWSVKTRLSSLTSDSTDLKKTSKLKEG